MTPSPSSSQDFGRRPAKQIDRLDTLRTLAVTIVVVFHLQPRLLPWGYIGVDMFFTLSGFLMSYLYLQARENPIEWSPKKFIMRRFWRLFPPLVIVNLITVVVAAFLMAPLHLLETATSAIASVVSVSNFYFHSQSGYFDTDAIVKPLLHTWSLGVEEQFYVLFAIALAVSRWLTLRTILVILTTASFAAWCAVLLGEMSDSVPPLHEEPYSSLFFLPQYRIFQFGLGGLAAYTMVAGFGGLRVLGFAIFIAAAYLASDKLYAHLSAPMVTVAMSLLMISPSILDRMAKFGPVKYVARISYQLYLVHWPIIVFWQYITFSEMTWIEAALCAAICIGSADILYRSTNWMRTAQ